MRIARVRHQDRDHYGVVVGERIRLLTGSPIVGPANKTGEEVALSDVHLLAPVEPSKIFGIGRNYAEHAKEMGFELPEDPSVFMKPPTSLLADGESVVLPYPNLSNEVQHEAELAIVIGRTARNVPASSALSHVYGYTCANDVSARDLQRKDTNPTRGKGFDTFCPIGPWIETELDPARLAIKCTVNGELRQDGSTSDLIFDVPAMIASLSAWSTLLPGDVILTGSPHGTGAMVDGDLLTIEIEGIGTLTNHVIATR